MESFGPLVPPDPWPPPEVDESSVWNSRFSRVPILGWFVRTWKRRRLWSRAYREVYYPMEERILAQLSARPELDVVTHGAPREQVVQALSAAVADEKCIEPPSIHPQDEIGLLLWGAYDDLTPLRFHDELEKRFRFRLPLRRTDSTRWFEKWWDERWTVDAVVDECVALLADDSDSRPDE